MTDVILKLDENLGLAHVELLRQAGYDAERVHDEGLSGSDDETVWRRACAEGRLFVTLDLDFADVRRFAPGTHPGILLLRPRTGGRQAVLDALSRVVRDQPMASLKGCLTIADERHTRIRRPTSSGS